MFLRLVVPSRGGRGARTEVSERVGECSTHLFFLTKCDSVMKKILSLTMLHHALYEMLSCTL